MAKKPKFTQGDDRFNLGAGDDLANAKGGNDSVSGGSGNDTLNGGAGNDFLRGGTGDDVLNGGEGDDRLVGGADDDTISGGAGTNIVDGGTGDDVLILDGNFADAKITATDTGFKIVTATGTTTVSNVESFEFADGVKGAGELLPGAGKTFVLTVPIDNIIGTSGDDTILGDSATFTADAIAGNDGKDTLRVALTTAGASYTPTMSGVERAELTGTATAAGQTFNLTNTTGLTAVSLNSGLQQLALNGVKAILDLEVSNTTGVGGSVAVAYDAAAVVGVTDTQKISLTNAVLTAGVTVNGAETVAITSGGTANNIGTLTDAAAKAITVTGAGNLTLTTAASSTALASLDASAATGKITATFGSTSDIAVKGGAADDTFNFGATLTSKDSVDGGAGKDTVSLVGGDYSLATNETLLGLNKLANVEAVRFTTSATTIDRATLTSAITSFTFDIGATAAAVANAKSTDTYAIGPTADVTSLTFNTVVPATLNVELAGAAAVVGTSASDDADVGAISGATASTLNLVSSAVAKDNNGVALASGIGIADTNSTDGNVNSAGTLTLAANASVKVTGDAHTEIVGLTNAANVDASALTGDFQIAGSTGADTILGSKGVNEIKGGAGTDTINITASAANVDTIDLTNFAAITATSSLDRDVVTGFKAGAGGDMLAFKDSLTTLANTGTATIQEFTAVTTVALTDFNSTTKDIIEFNFNTVGTTLGDGSANSLNGTNLLALVTSGAGTFDVQTDGDDMILVAYQNGNAYVYGLNESADVDTGLVEADEIQLLAEIKGVAVGGLDVGNFDFIT